MPRTVRVNFKSGVLPQPRQVVPRLRTAREESEYQKIPQKFAEEAMAPRGSSANPPARLPKTAQQKIELSAKAPMVKHEQSTKNEQSSKSEQSAKSEQGVWKQHIAEVRRTYLASALRAYEQQEQRYKQFREQREAESAAQEATRLSGTTESPATLLTTPTIESSLLRGQMIEKRTPEEIEELQLKRTYNRKLTEKAVVEDRSAQLLQLYQQASKFITINEQLESRVVDLFKPQRTVPTLSTNDTQTPAWWKYVRTDLAWNQADAQQRSRETELRDALQGTVRVSGLGSTVRELPGLKKVVETLDKN